MPEIAEDQIDLQPNVQRTLLSFNHAQILSIPLDTAGIVTVLPAPGVGKAYRLVDSLWLLDTSAGAYTVEPGTEWCIYYGTNTDDFPASGYLVMSQWLGQAGRAHLRFRPATYAPGELDDAPPVPRLHAEAGNLLTGIENKPLTLIDFQAEYLGGHADNTLTAIIDYIVDDV